MIVVQERLRVHSICCCKTLVTIQTVLVHRHLTCHHQLEDVGKEIHLVAHRLHRIIQSGIGIIGKAQLTIDVSSPHHILLHRGSSRERNLCTGGDVAGIRFVRSRLPCRLLTACLRLRHDALHHSQEHEYEQYLFHYFTL